MLLRRWISLAIVMWLTGPASAAELQPDFFPVHRSEPFLLHRHIEPAMLHTLKVWDSRLANWRAMQTAEAPGERAQVMLLHIWADWCGPCREEFPTLRKSTELLEKTYGDRIQIVLLSETSGPELMRAFLAKYGAQMPHGLNYLDTGEAIAASLRTELPTPLSYPLTLVLDSQRIVRHAIVGSIATRRAELLAAVARLAAPPPPAAPTPFK